MALIAVAKSDAFVAVFDAKYHYVFWRPITAIRNGDTDDNPRTERDATWQPIEATPMHPEYPCAYCIQSGSLAGVVEAMFGTVDIPEIAITSPTAPGITTVGPAWKAMPMRLPMPASGLVSITDFQPASERKWAIRSVNTL
jgi:hypothetical protein